MGRSLENLLSGQRPRLMCFQVLVYALLTGWMTAQDSPGEIIQEAIRKHQEGDLESAILQYERFLALTQPHPIARLAVNNL